MNNSSSPIEELIKKRLSTLYYKLRNNPKKINILKYNLITLLSEEIQKLKIENKIDSPPFNPFQIKKIKGIDINIEFFPRIKIGSEGKLEVVDNNFLIKLDENLQNKKNLFRLRTTMSHELMHIFFYDLNLPIKKLGYGITQRKYILMEEEVCHHLTREFLMPEKSIYTIIENSSGIECPSISNLSWLKSKFIVSSDIVAYRMIKDLKLWNTIYAKYIQKNLEFKPVNWLKYNDNRFFKRITFPREIPSDKNEWHKFISENVYQTIEKNYIIIEKDFFNKNIISESIVESNMPLGIIFLVKIKN